MLTEAQKAIRAEFDRLVNMSVEEMQQHYSSPESDFASLHPPVAARLNKTSGKTLGKRALALKRKEEWDEADFTAASGMINPLKLQLGRHVQYQREDGSLTPFAIALRNRGHDPLKDLSENPVITEPAPVAPDQSATVAEGLTVGEIERRLNKQLDTLYRTEFGGDYPDDIGQPVVECGSLDSEKCTVAFRWDGEINKIGYKISGNEVTLLPETMGPAHNEWVSDNFGTADGIPVGEITAVTEATETSGPQWHAIMIRAGFAKNLAPNGKPRLYSDAALEAAVSEGLFDNIPGFQRTDPEHGEEEGTVVAGTWGKAVWDAASRTVKNTFTWLKEKYPSLIHSKIKVALTEGKKEQLPGFSITGNVIVDKSAPNIIQKIVAVRSCDPISFPSAGGELLAITESHIKESDPMKIKITEALTAKGLTVPPALAKQWETITVAEGAAAEFMVAQLKDKKAKLFEKMPDLEAKLSKDETMLVALFEDFMAAEGVDVKSTDTSGDGTDTAGGVPATESHRVREGVSPALLAHLNSQAYEGVLASSALDEIQKNSIRSRFTNVPFDPTKVQEAVREALEIQESYAKASPRSTRIDVSKDAVDKLQQAANDFFCSDVTDVSVRESIISTSGRDVISKNHRGTMRSLRGLYIQLTGDDGLTFDITKVRESIDPATMTKILQNAMNLRLLREYSMASVYESWKLIADIVPLADFKKQETMRTGYFGSLSRINENDPYPELAQSGKLDASYTPETYGALVSVHRKQIINDNVGEVRRIPSKISMGAKLDLSRFVWSLLLDNPQMSDGKEVFHTDHANLLAGNTAAAGLAEATLSTLDGKLKDQTVPGRDDKLMLPTKYVIIPANQAMRKKLYEVMALAFGQNNNVPTFAQSLKVEGIECPHASDADDWYVATDKAINEILEVGFFQGREEPEILVADNDLAGALFTHDKVQYKIRHEYGGSVIDYRGIAKAAVTA